MTTLGFFWMALWAFCLGYVISSAIQVFVTRQRMKETMGEAGAKSVGLGTFFGFISSSCSFAALSTSRSIFQKGAGLVPALAFLLASTNLVVELGIVIFVFLSWQFVLGEYLGGLLLIGVMWLVVKLTLPARLEKQGREHAQQSAGDGDDEDVPDWRKLIRSLHGWRKTSRRYFMEWKMVWKDVTIGFTVAGIIAVFVPKSFFEALFIGSASSQGPAWWQTALHTLIGPVAAFFTFIGSMGNIPLAGVLYSSGVSFAGVMAFIFSDLVVLPVLRINAHYYGWKMALYIVGVFLASLVAAALAMHYGFAALGMLPDPASAKVAQTQPGERFAIDYTFFLNIFFFLVSLAAGWMVLRHRSGGGGHGGGHQHGHGGHNHGGSDWARRLLTVLAVAAIVWLIGGVVLWFLPLS
jgi:hypothetical protein